MILFQVIVNAMIAKSSPNKKHNCLKFADCRKLAQVKFTYNKSAMT